MERKGLTGSQLKLIAITAMTIDHFTWLFFPGYDTRWFVVLLHIIGRLTAPIMCFFIAEGSHYTRDRKRYALRLFAFALVSHFAYCAAFDIPMVPFRSGVLNQTGILWSLAWGLVAISIDESPQLRTWQKMVLILLICIITLPSDWSCVATLVVVNFASNRGNFKKQAWGLVLFVATYALIYAIFQDVFYGILQMTVVLALPLLRLYNGQRGAMPGGKWLFYLYYPGHLALMGILRLFL